MVLHCFSMPGRARRVPGARLRGCSFAGNVTYPRPTDLAGRRARVPLDRVLVETDAPVPGAAARARQAERAVERRAHRALRRGGCGGSPTRSWRRRSSATPRGCSGGEPRRAEGYPRHPAQPAPPARVRRAAQPRAGPELPGGLQHPRRDRRAAELDDRRRGAGGRRWPRACCPEYLAARVGSRPRGRGGPRHWSRRCATRWRPFGNATLHLADAMALDLAALRPGAEQGRGQPALRHRRHRDPAHDRGAAGLRLVGRDGPARGRRAAGGGAGHARVRAPLGARAARPATCGSLRTVSRNVFSPGAERGLRPRRPAPPRHGRPAARCARSCRPRSPTAARRWRAPSRWRPARRDGRARARAGGARGDGPARRRAGRAPLAGTTSASSRTGSGDRATRLRPGQGQPVPVPRGRCATTACHELVTVDPGRVPRRRAALRVGRRGRTTRSSARGSRARTSSPARVRAYRETSGARRPPVRVQIDKRVPVAAGMGGGSSDAAPALLALAGSPAGSVRARLAASLGSDVPALMQPGPTLVTGAGEEVRPLGARHADRELRRGPAAGEAVDRRGLRRGGPPGAGALPVRARGSPPAAGGRGGRCPRTWSTTTCRTPPARCAP